MVLMCGLKPLAETRFPSPLSTSPNVLFPYLMSGSRGLHHQWLQNVNKGLSAISTSCPCCPTQPGTVSTTAASSTPCSTTTTSSSTSTTTAKLDSKPPIVGMPSMFPHFPLPATSAASMAITEGVKEAKEEVFNASVAELRRKAEEHSAALWHLAQSVQHQKLLQHQQQVTKAEDDKIIKQETKEEAPEESRAAEQKVVKTEKSSE